MKQLWVVPMLLAGVSLYTSVAQQGCGDNACPVIAPLPQVGLSQKQIEQIDLDGYVADPDNADSELQFTVSGIDTSKVAASIDASTHVLTLTAASTFEGSVTLTIKVTDPAGCVAEATLDVMVHANRSCSTVFRYDSKAYGAVSTVSVAGQFNGWSTTANPLTDSDGDGIYTSPPLTLSKGWSQYKLVRNGSDWILDADNPYRAWDGGFENSEIEVGDCNIPLLQLDSLETDGVTGQLTAVISYVDGAEGKGPDVTGFSVTAGGDEVDPVFDNYTRTLTVALSALEAGKYTLRANASTNSGKVAEELFVPAWVEVTPFSWDRANLYFAFTDRFEDGNPSNNAPVSGVDSKANYQGGDWAGLKAKIEGGYFDAQGINAIWVSPQINNTPNAFPGDDGRYYSAYHGYWPVDSSAPEEKMGSDSDLRAMIDAAHARGIRVMFDLVANHVHNEHPYWANHFTSNDSTSDWFNAYALCKDADNWNTIPVTCWFAWYLPDLDFKNPDALHTVAADAQRLIRSYDVDGFRVDAVKHVETAFLRHLVADVEKDIEHHSSEPGQQFYLVGETFTGEWNYSCNNTSSCSQYLQKMYVGPGLLDGQFDFPMYWQILKTFARNEATMVDLDKLVVSSTGYYGDDALMSLFLGNHDVARFVSHANGDISDMYGSAAKEQGWTNPPAAPTSYVPYQKLQLAFTFLASMPGVPLVYYGDDIGLPGAGDPDNRRMMKFDSELSSYESQTLSMVKKLMSLRADHESLSARARTTLLGTDPDVYVYGKTGSTEKSVVAINRASTSKTVTVSISALGLANGKVLTDAINGGTITVSSGAVTLTLPAYTAAVYF